MFRADRRRGRRCRVKLERAGQFITHNAWENYQFRNQKGFQNLIPTPLNPVELAGGQFHLRPMTVCLQPSRTDRDTRVEATKA